jgi:hypothetical protein
MVHSVKLEAGTGLMRPDAERVMMTIRRATTAYRYLTTKPNIGRFHGSDNNAGERNIKVTPSPIHPNPEIH